MYADTQLTKYKVLDLIYETYNIIPQGEEIPCSLFTVEGVEGLVKDNAIPREIATLIYKLMIENGED